MKLSLKLIWLRLNVKKIRKSIKKNEKVVGWMIEREYGGGIQGVPIQGSQHLGLYVDKGSVSVWRKLTKKNDSFVLDKPVSGPAMVSSFT